MLQNLVRPENGVNFASSKGTNPETIWRIGVAASTPPSQGGDSGSIPGFATKKGSAAHIGC